MADPIPNLGSRSAQDDQRLPIEDRLALCDELWEEYLVLNPDQPAPFVKQFASFDEYASWRRRRDRPWLY